MIATSGARSRYASATPVSKLVAPGPRVERQTPAFPVSRPWTSAMKAAPCSCRAATNWICESTSEFKTSSVSSPGTPKIHCTSSFSRQRSSSSDPFMIIPSIWLLWFIRFVLFKQTNETNQINQMNPSPSRQSRVSRSSILRGLLFLPQTCRPQSSAALKWFYRILARIIHERFCCNRRSAAATSLRPAGSPLGPSTYCTSTLGASRLCAPVSRRGSAISRRTH